MSIYAYWEACEQAPEVPSCSECSIEVDPYTMVQCWACNTHTCEDCVDAYGWPCSHFTEDQP